MRDSCCSAVICRRSSSTLAAFWPSTTCRRAIATARGLSACFTGVGATSGALNACSACSIATSRPLSARFTAGGGTTRGRIECSTGLIACSTAAVGRFTRSAACRTAVAARRKSAISCCNSRPWRCWRTVWRGFNPFGWCCNTASLWQNLGACSNSGDEPPRRGGVCCNEGSGTSGEASAWGNLLPGTLHLRRWSLRSLRLLRPARTWPARCQNRWP